VSLLPYDVRRGEYNLRVTPLGDGGTYYILTRGIFPTEGKVVLAFSITRQGWLIGDARDTRTAKRAQTLTANLA
jgi:hypothetical protein